jgi:hypothetical protein
VAPDEVVVALGLVQGFSAVADLPGVGPVQVNGAQELTVEFDPAYLVHLGSAQLQAIATGSTEVVFGFNGITDTVQLTIVDDPSALSAAFDYGAEEICAGGTVTFTDHSQGLVVSRSWNFPGGVPASSYDAQVTVSYPVAGSYPVELITTFVNGLDTMLMTDLITVEAAPIVNIVDLGDALTVDPSDASYQWLDCTNGNVPIIGATDAVFTPTQAGSYSVEVQVGACTVTAECVAFVPMSIGDRGSEHDLIVIPNPSNGRFELKAPEGMNARSIDLRDITGRVLLSRSAGSRTRLPFEMDLASGVYFIDVHHEQGISTVRISVQ